MRNDGRMMIGWEDCRETWCHCHYHDAAVVVETDDDELIIRWLGACMRRNLKIVTAKCPSAMGLLLWQSHRSACNEEHVDILARSVSQKVCQDQMILSNGSPVVYFHFG